MRKITQEEFEARVAALDKGYTAVGTYVNSRQKVEINCEIHGSFFITPSNLLSGGWGCAKCSGNYVPTQEEFEAHVVALDKGYTVIGNYHNALTKVELNCPVHGSFFIAPNVLRRGFGCAKCSGNYVPTQEEFEARVIALGKGYTAIGTYKNSCTKVEINCEIHGSFFIIPSDLYSDHGCPMCSGNYVPTQEEFEERVVALGKGYTAVGPYVKNKQKVEINCEIHGSFFTTPGSLYRGSGCPMCAVNGFNPNKPAILYYFEVEGLYKIGITNRTLAKRYDYKSDRDKINVIQITKYDNGQEAADAERLIIRTFKAFLYKGESPLKTVGTAEMFTYDVLGLDNRMVA